MGLSDRRGWVVHPNFDGRDWFVSTHLVASPRTTVGRIRLDLPPRSHPFQVIRTRMQRGMKRSGKGNPTGRGPDASFGKRSVWRPPPCHVTPGSAPASPALSTVQLVPDTHVPEPGRPVLRATDACAPLGRVFIRIDPDVRSSAAEDRKRQAGGSPSLSPRRIWDEWFVCAGNGGRSNSHGARAS